MVDVVEVEEEKEDPGGLGNITEKWLDKKHSVLPKSQKIFSFFCC